MDFHKQYKSKDIVCETKMKLLSFLIYLTLKVFRKNALIDLLDYSYFDIPTFIFDFKQQ